MIRLTTRDLLELPAGPNTPIWHHLMEETKRPGEGKKKSRRDGTTLKVFHRVGLLSNEPTAVACSLWTLPESRLDRLGATTSRRLRLHGSVRLGAQSPGLTSGGSPDGGNVDFAAVLSCFESSSTVLACSGRLARLVCSRGSVSWS